MSLINKKIFFRILLREVLLWTSSAVLIWFWRIISDKIHEEEYVVIILLTMCWWIIIGIFCGRYKKGLKRSNFLYETIRLFITTIICAVTASLVTLLYSGYSHNIIFFTTIGVCVISWFMMLGYYAYRYAINPEEKITLYDKREPQPLQSFPTPISKRDQDDRQHIVENIFGKEILNMLMENVNLFLSTTKLISTHDVYNFLSVRSYHYETMINLTLLNNIRGINKLFCAINSKLPDNGKLVCCFIPQEHYKNRILSKYPCGLNYIIYSYFFLIKRVLPRMLFTSRLYYDITKGKGRFFSETEILGRLYFCGFAVDNVIKKAGRTFVFAHRIKEPEKQVLRSYGPLISLPRIGKNQEIINVYKMRTMHPYSEFLQDYIYEKNKLQEGGKFANDIRITTIGAFMRRTWIDELPMILNFIKGDMKLVGVRPLSRQYFGLYPKDLQILRTSVKPGLLPPFYVDMPKTQEEIFDSEKRYLEAYKKSPFLTDLSYFFRIFYTIIFKRARSK